MTNNIGPKCDNEYFTKMDTLYVRSITYIRI